MKKWKNGEIALLCALAVTLVWGAVSLQQQDALADKVIRLHVIANSDEEADQTLKLQVRDKVLTYTSLLLEDAANLPEAKTRLRAALPAMEAVALQEVKRQGESYGVTVELSDSEFPTKTYDGFALPAGEYMALRVLIGDGEGQNWWCVVYPSLCSVGEDWSGEGKKAGLTQEELSLMEQKQDGYVFKFRAVEWWETLRKWLGK